MAEVTGLRNNALPYPVYGVAYGITFPLLDADGDPTSPSSPDSEVSKNGDTFADCTNEATEIATSSGICYLLLTASEMTADVVTVRIQSTGAKTTVITLYPRKLVTLATGTCQGSNDTGDIQLASSDSAVDDYYNGCLCVAVIDGTTEARIINDYVGSTKVGEVSPAWNTAQPDSNDTYTIYQPEGRQFALGDTKAFGGTAGTFSSGRPEVNATHAAGTAVTLDANNVLNVSTKYVGGTLQTARDIGASVLLSSGTGTGQVKLSSGYVAPNWGDVGNPTTTVNLSGTSTKAVEPTVAGRTLDISAGGEAGIDWANVGTPGSTVNLSATTVNLTNTVTTYTGNTPQTGDTYAIANSGTHGNAALKTLIDTIDDFIDTEVAAIKAKTDNLPASPAAVGSAMTLDLTQAVPTSNTAQTVGDALNAARAQGFGKWAIVGTTLTLYANDGTTAVKTFTLDSTTAPTSRT